MYNLKGVISPMNDIDEVNEIKSSIAEYMINQEGFAPLGGRSHYTHTCLVEVYLNAKTTRQ